MSVQLIESDLEGNDSDQLDELSSVTSSIMFPVDGVILSRTKSSIPLRMDYLLFLGYSLVGIGAILILCLEYENSFIRFHAWQSLFFSITLLTATCSIMWTVGEYWPEILTPGFLFCLVLFLVYIPLIFCGYMAYKTAPTTRPFYIPLFGTLATYIILHE